MHVLVADRSRAVAAEVTDKVVRTFEAEDGLLVRTNHYFAPDLQELAPTFEENHSSFDRYTRATAMLRKRHGDIGMHDILTILSDHSPDWPATDSICRHGDGDAESLTCAATIACPEDRTLWATLANPCEGIQAVGQSE
jgi:hypothetical protein